MLRFRRERARLIPTRPSITTVREAKSAARGSHPVARAASYSGAANLTPWGNNRQQIRERLLRQAGPRPDLTLLSLSCQRGTIMGCRIETWLQRDAYRFPRRGGAVFS